MGRGPGHRPLIILRWILLGLLVLAAAVVLRIYLARDTEPPVPRAVTADPESPVESGEAVLIADDFEYEVIDEGVTLFLIRSQRMVSDRQDRFVLEGVELQTEEEGGGLYTIASDKAIYDRNTNDATLEGSVIMTGPDGIELRGEAFTLERGGKVLESTVSPVAYRLPGAYDGTATGVRLNVNRNTVLLRGNVAIESPAGAEPRLSLTAARMYYSEEEALLRTEGGVVFRRGGDLLRSRRLTVRFASREQGGGVGDVRFVQGRWDVAGRIVLDSRADRSGSLEFEAETMGVAFDETGDRVESVVLEGEEREATMRLADGTGLLQTLRAGSIFTGFAEGRVSRLETYVPAVLEEGLALPGAAPLRRLCGNTLSAELDAGGGLGDLRLDGSVDYQDARLSASGDRLEGDPERRLELSGAPARLLAGDDDVEAPEIVYSRSEGSLIARGGVRATGLDRSGVELASGEVDAPVLVTADQATWREEPPEVAFVGKVRAWQGESFMLADRLRVLEDGERLLGEGSVRTVWRPDPEDAAGRRPIEVNASQLDYRRQARQLNYSGDVRAHEAGRTLRCDDLEILTDDERQIESLLCQGNTEVDDPVNGRTVRGSEALYTPGDRLVLISGAPVIMEQQDGTAMEGRRLRYDLDTGQVRILSEPRTSGPEAELVEPQEGSDG